MSSAKPEYNDDVTARVTRGGIAPRPPVFQDKLEEREWLKFRLAQAFRIFGEYRSYAFSLYLIQISYIIGGLGYDEGIAGHITVRDNIRPDCFWVNPMVRVSLMSFASKAQIEACIGQTFYPHPTE